MSQKGPTRSKPPPSRPIKRFPTRHVPRDGEPALNELDYLVGRRAFTLAIGDHSERDRQYREMVRKLTRPKKGSAEKRISDALNDGLLVHRPDELLAKAFTIFDPKGLWIRLRALEPYDRARDDEKREVFELRRREARRGLALLKKLQTASDTIYRSDPDAQSSNGGKEFFDEALHQLRWRLKDFENDANDEIAGLQWRRHHGFPEDSRKAGLVTRRRLVLFPAIAALRDADEGFWSYERICKLIERSNEFWSEDPCPSIGNKHRRTSKDSATTLKIAYHRYLVEQRIERILAAAKSPLTVTQLCKRCELSETTVSKVVSTLNAAGRVRKQDAGYTTAPMLADAHFDQFLTDIARILESLGIKLVEG